MKSLSTQKQAHSPAAALVIKLAALTAIFFLTACAGTTKVKYIYAHAGSEIERPADGEVLTAPPGKHYAVFLVSCVDNTDRDDAFSFSTTRLRTGSSNADRTPLSGQFSPTSFGVPAGDIEQAPEGQSLARVVFLIDMPAEAGVKGELFYESQSGESVLMVNQTPYGPSVSSPSSQIRYDEIEGSPFLGSDTCVDTGSYH